MPRFCPLDIVPFVTLGLGFFTIAFSFYIWREDESLQSVAFCGFESHENFFYKAFASKFSHLTYLHLSLNVLFLLDVGFNLEKQLGSFGFLFLYGIALLGIIGLGCLYHAFIFSGCSVGASAVLFSIFTFWCYNCEGNLFFLGIVPSNPIYVPWLFLILCQLFFWSSATGLHACGIVFGIFTYYIIPKSFWDALKCSSDVYHEPNSSDNLDNDYPSESVPITSSGNNSFNYKTDQHNVV
ncbi:unnamed protein product [Phytomonas sp. Hart1]|nr:unnamed protein product [Phytomonas sp. Hart1]|eukprot:CCW71842.1 unnamed protein product [Phytomonas sp. isolate Hart1]